jgi:HlyD family secretion protein
MSNRSRVLTWGLPFIGGATLLLGTGLVVNNRPVIAEETPPRQPTMAPTVPGSANACGFIGAIGTSEPSGEAVAIAAHTSGVVASVAVRVGDSVEIGQPLFTVDTTRAEADVMLRRAEIEVAEGELESLRASVPPLRAGVRSAEASLASARADLLVAKTDLADRQNLLRIATAVSDPRAISKEEVDRRRFAADQAEARVATAEAAVERAVAGVVQAEAELGRFIDPARGVDGPELLAATSRVGQARQALRRVEADLKLLTVRSPLEGKVLQVNIRPGEFAPASVPTEGLVVLGRNGPAHLRVEIDEVDIPRFSAGAQAWASPRGDAQARISLTLRTVEPLVVPKRNLAGRTSELVDTRVLQVVYELGREHQSPGIGQQFDVYIEASGGGS